MDYSKHISIQPDIRFGAPCIKGTRISVFDVLGWLANGMTNDEIATDYPEVTPDNILACLAFAADREHRFRIAS
jgi:uncharacterized protein (DUF433 family)